MYKEFSAGGIVFRKINGNREILISQHSAHHGWVFPKGHVGDTDKNETPEEAALREVAEETGIHGKIIKKLMPTAYWYVFNGQKRYKTVQYFLMAYLSGDTNNHDFEMEHVEWLPVDKIAEKLTYTSDKKVWKEAKKLLDKQE